MSLIEINGKKYPLAEGHLCDFDLWDESFAHHVAHTTGLTLTSDHLELVEMIRAYYREFSEIPQQRAIVSRYATHLGIDKAAANARLKQLFPVGANLQAQKIAGLPRPPHCCL